MATESKPASSPKHRGCLYVEGVPESTKSAFKSRCYQNEKTIRGVMIALMRAYAHEPETLRDLMVKYYPKDPS